MVGTIPHVFERFTGAPELFSNGATAAALEPRFGETPCGERSGERK